MTKVAECDSGNKLQTFTCNYVAKPRECWNILVTTLVASVAIAGFSLVLWDVTLSVSQVLQYGSHDAHCTVTK